MSHIPMYSVPVLVDNLNKIRENISTTTENINNPSASYFQTTLVELLKEFGFHLNPATVGQDMFLDGISGIDASLLKETDLVDTILVAAQYFFRSVGGCDIEFGLMDLLDPKPIRVRKFLSVVVNFWLFCNNQYNSAIEIRENVLNLAGNKRNKEEKIHEFHRKIETLRVSKAEQDLKADKIKADMAAIEEELAKVCVTSEEIKMKMEPIKAQVSAMKEKEEILRKEIENLEAAERRLKILVRADEMKQTFELELSKSNEEFDMKMSRQERNQKIETQLQQHEADIKSFIEMLHPIQSALKKIISASEELKSKENKLDSVRETIALKDARLNQLTKELSDLKGSLASTKRKWNTKKSCMESELSEYEARLMKLRQEMSEEDIVASELQSNIQRIRDGIAEEDRSMREAVAKFKEMYQEFKSKLLDFNDTFDTDFEAIIEAMARLDKYAP